MQIYVLAMSPTVFRALSEVIFDFDEGDYTLGVDSEIVGSSKALPAELAFSSPDQDRINGRVGFVFDQKFLEQVLLLKSAGMNIRIYDAQTLSPLISSDPPPKQPLAAVG